MIVDRRTFIVSTALGATAAGLANLLPLSPTLRASLPPATLLATLPGRETDRNGVVFKIAGWDCCDAVAMDGSNTATPESVANDPTTDDKVFIRIGLSWRATWR